MFDLVYIVDSLIKFGWGTLLRLCLLICCRGSLLLWCIEWRLLLDNGVSVVSSVAVGVAICVAVDIAVVILHVRILGGHTSLLWKPVWIMVYRRSGGRHLCRDIAFRDIIILVILTCQVLVGRTIGCS